MQARQKEEQQESMRKEILQKILTADAQERIGTTKLVKADKARKLEDMMIGMAQQGQVKQQINDAQLKQMLESITDSGEGKGPKIQFDRRRFGDDSDSDIDLDGL